MSPSSPETTGTNFNGADFNDAGFDPPDSMGAAGPIQFLTCVNGWIRVRSKTGTLGPLNMSSSTFFSPVKVGPDPFDPRVRYDRDSQRFFVLMADDVATNNRLLLAVSDGPVITGSSSFTFFFFQQNLVAPAGDNNRLADFPTLGIDRNALYIGCNMYDATDTFRGTTGFVVRKSSVLGAGPIVATAFRSMATDTASGPVSPQGVDNGDPGATEGYFIGVDSLAFDLLVLRRVSDPGGSPTLSGNIFLAVPPTTFPMGGVNSLSSNPLDDIDDRLGNAQMKTVGGVTRLYTVHNFQVNTSGSADDLGGRDGSRWYEIGNLSTTPTLIQSGTLFDPSSGGFPTSYWMPSIAVSGPGNLVVACNATRDDQYVSTVSAGRIPSDAAGSLRSPSLGFLSTFGFAPSAPGTVERWGDYSFTCVDPNDDMTFWTVQQYVIGPDVWAAGVMQLRAPLPPANPVVSPASIPAEVASVNLTLTAAGADPDAYFDPGPGFANRISASSIDTVTLAGVLVNGITVVSRTQIVINVSTVGVPPGTHNLTVTNPDGQSRVQASAFTVGAASGEPSCTITGPASPSNSNPLSFTVAFSEDVTGLDAADFTLVNAVSPILSGGPATYTLTVVPSSDGDVSVTLPAGLATGTGSALTNTVSNTLTIRSDGTAPTCSVSAQVAQSNAAPLYFNIVFSEDVTGLSAGGFAVTNGTVTGVVGIGRYYYAIVSPTVGEGTVMLSVNAGAAQDAAGNPNAASNTASTLFDNVPPGCTVSAPAAATNTSPIPFTLTFSEPVTGLVGAEVAVTGGTGMLSGTGADYTFSVTPSGQGTVTVQVPAGVAQDALGNLNTASNLEPTDYDSIAPNTTLTSMPPDPSGSPTADFTFVSSQPGSTFQVELDGAGFSANATGSASYAGLLPGTHTFQVRAVDPAGNVDPTPASYSWVIPFLLMDGIAPFLNGFDSAFFGSGFTFASSSPPVVWAVDGTPAGVSGGAFATGPSSLNYNNGTNYNSPGVSNTGNATSPVIDRSALATALLKFRCNYQTDTTGTLTDRRFVDVGNSDFSTLHQSVQLSGGASPLGACAAMGTWHEHFLLLDPAWGNAIRVRFDFDTVDAAANTGGGWFVDDLEVSDLLVTGLHQYVSGSATPLRAGQATTSTQIEFRAAVSGAAIGNVQLEVEVKPLGTGFDGLGTVAASATGAGSLLVVAQTVAGLGDYHWRARTVETGSGTTSAWLSFGANDETVPDFSVVAAAAGGGGGGGGGGCGATGWEALLVAGLAALLRPRRL